MFYSLVIDHSVRPRDVEHALMVKVVQAGSWLHMRSESDGSGSDEEGEREHRGEREPSRLVQRDRETGNE